MNKDIMKQAGFSEEVERVEQGLCAICSKPIKDTVFRNKLSVKEFRISGMCQKCQDKFFGVD